MLPVVAPGVPSSSMRMPPKGVTTQSPKGQGENVGGATPFMLKQLFCAVTLVAPERISSPDRPALVKVLPSTTTPPVLPKSP